MATPHSNSVSSPDGTTIACYESGAGPPLVLVHGANVDHLSWTPLLLHLEPHYRVITYDRRGRGASSDALDYEVEREVEDLLAVIEAAGEPVHIFGHSSGAILALEAAKAGAPLRSLVLYEPPYALDAHGPLLRLSLAIQVEHFILEHDPEMALEAFFLAAGQTEDDIQAMREGPRWQNMLALAHTTTYDLRVSALKLPEPGTRLSVEAPVLLIAGGLSGRAWRQACEVVASALPDTTVTVLEGEGHFAIYSAPDLVAREVAGFLTGRMLPSG